MVEDVINAVAHFATGCQISNVALDHSETRGSDQGSAQDFIEIPTMAGREIVQANDSLTESKQLLQDV
jgi:hypothetical protein